MKDQDGRSEKYINVDSDYENELMDHIDQFSEKTSRAGVKNEGAISIKKIDHRRTLSID